MVALAGPSARGRCPSVSSWTGAAAPLLARLVTAMALVPGLHPNLCSWSSREQTRLNAPSGSQESCFFLEPLVTETTGM